ncbi:MAG: hypothetical protein KI790_01690 [Cyclobacteriaceae bacterium]|nr:hypothetical protein [Cyclobacteriaceae bacterium HetDA_MAG_MS6]
MSSWWLKLTFRQRNYALLIGFALLMLLSYFVAFGKTIALHHENSQLEKSGGSGFSPATYAKLAEEKSRLDSIYQQVAGINYEGRLLESVARLSGKHKTKVISVEELTGYRATRVDRLVVSGSYFSLIRLLRDFQDQFHSGLVRSLDFHVVKDRKSKTKRLLLDLYIEKLKVDEVNS